MTRTARAAYPRAVLKDRSESRSGLDTSIRKDGAGQHNWGSIADEQHLESAALEDEMADERMYEEERKLDALNSPTVSGIIPGGESPLPSSAAGTWKAEIPCSLCW